METFSPHYSHAIAKYIAHEVNAAALMSMKRGKHRAHERSLRGNEDKLVLYEAGGGTGTHALHMLNWLQEHEPSLYRETEYNIVEISHNLAAKQREKVCSVHKVSSTHTS